MVDTLSHPLPEEPIAELAPAAITLAVPDDQRAWRRALAAGLGAFVISRVLTIVGAYSLVQFESLQRWNRRLPIADSSRRLIETHFLQWDGRWYRLIARVGYQSDLPEKISYVPDNGGATVAFFPGYPILARWFDHVFPGNLDYALLGINVVFGVVAVVLVGLLARDVFGVEVAERSMILFCLFPGSVVLSWSYSEPLLVVCAAACLLLLSRGTLGCRRTVRSARDRHPPQWARAGGVLRRRRGDRDPPQASVALAAVGPPGADRFPRLLLVPESSHRRVERVDAGAT